MTRRHNLPRAPRPPHPARKRFGQHFLEPAWVDKLIRAIDPRPHDRFIEIGPGHGALTRPLAARVKAVVAYEIDRDLAAELRGTMPPNVTIIEGDFLGQPLITKDQALSANDRRPTSDQRLTTDDERVSTDDQRLRVAANLPYNVASPMLFRLVEWTRAGVPLSDATLMLQREVADRLVAAPGSREYGVLSILIGHRATATRLLTLPPGAFRPPPTVNSAVVRLQFHPPDPPVRDESRFAAIVQAVFTRRRKTVANALLAYVGSERGQSGVRAPGTGVRASTIKAFDLAGIDGRRRPETLTIGDFARLADVLVV